MCGPNGAHDHDPRACDDATVRELGGRCCGRRPGKRPLRIGIGGPVGSGKTALVEQFVPQAAGAGHRDGRHHQRHRDHRGRRARSPHPRRYPGRDRIVGVETGSCPHTAVREDPSMNLAALEALNVQFPTAQVALVESGGDNLTLTFSRRLVDFSIYVIDVAGGDKIPRKRGPGLIRSDLLVINKVDLAPYVGATLDVMARDSDIHRQGRPFLFTNCQTGEGVDAVLDADAGRGCPVPVFDAADPARAWWRLGKVGASSRWELGAAGGQDPADRVALPGAVPRRARPLPRARTGRSWRTCWSPCRPAALCRATSPRCRSRPRMARASI